MRVLLFAGAREAVGAAQVTLDVAGALTARGVLAALCEQYPALAPYRASLRVAVNDAYAAWDDVVAPDDEVAIIPPVAGG